MFRKEKKQSVSHQIEHLRGFVLLKKPMPCSYFISVSVVLAIFPHVQIISKEFLSTVPFKCNQINYQKIPLCEFFTVKILKIRTVSLKEAMPTYHFPTN